MWCRKEGLNGKGRRGSIKVGGSWGALDINFCDVAHRTCERCGDGCVPVFGNGEERRTSTMDLPRMCGQSNINFQTLS